jgi:hypothetical protein
MRILITGIGGPTPRSIARRIREIYPNAFLIGTDIHPLAIGFYIDNLVDVVHIGPKAGDSEYWNDIYEIIKKHKIDFAFVQPENEVREWGEYFLKNGKYPIPTLIPPYQHTAALMNKARMAELLKETDYIPKTITIKQNEFNPESLREIGFPCWIRASVGSGGLGSLKLNSEQDINSWLFIHKSINEFTISEFLPGRHLANQMLYVNGKLIKNAGLHCVEYVMADIAPSKVTGNTSYGKFINDDTLLQFCEDVMDFIQLKTGVLANGVYSFDLKEDENGNLKVTEINIRHMAYTGIMAKVGFDLVHDSIKLLTGQEKMISQGNYFYPENYIFLRDVDERPIILKEEEIINYIN